MKKRHAIVFFLIAVAGVPAIYPEVFNDLNLYQHRMLSILLLAIILWSSELIPIYATSLVIISLKIILLSDQSLSFLNTNQPPLTYQSVLNHFAAPIIFLFIGGFSLASAARKYQIDRVMAKYLLRPFGEKPANVMFGLIVITALFSMFMSNTATTAMMLAILAPVLKQLPADDPANKGFILAIPLAANIGGIGTPIGTPPNAVAIQYLNSIQTISFGGWMYWGMPFVLILLLLAWFWLMILFKPNAKSIRIDVERESRSSRFTWLIYVTFFLTISLWLTGPLHGINAYVVALFPIAIFFATGILDQYDLRNFNWEVLWLITGGIALGDGMTRTGLSDGLIEMLPLNQLDLPSIIFLFMVVAFVMANFISNTATATLIIPLMMSAVAGHSAMASVKPAIIQIAIICSLGMALPISTPPNALAFAQGKIESIDLILTGGVIGMMGFLIVYLSSCVMGA